MRSLTDKVVVVTGASRGIGAAIAKHFVSEGAIVVFAARNKTRLQRSFKNSAAMKERSLIISGDVSSGRHMKKMISQTVKQFGRIDIFVNNAGIGTHKPVERVSEKDFDTIMNTNLKAVYLSFRELIPLYKKQKGGQIINISSGAARTGHPGLAVYAASKAAVNVLSESAAGEVRNDNIKISVLSPASTDTGLMSNMHRKSKTPSRASKKLTVDEVAEAVIFIAKQNKNAWTSMADIRPLSVKK